MMRPPRKRTADAGTSANSQSRGNDKPKHTPTAGSDQSARPFVVVIDGGRRQEWQRFATASEAEGIASKLRRHGFAASVRDEREAPQ